MDLKPFLEEANWAPLERQGKRTSYTRPMYGSEVLLQQTHRFMDGLGEVVMGITLDTTFDKETLKAKMLEGLSYCRFVSPILASTIEIGVYDPDLPSWVYTPAADAAEAMAWATENLEFIEEPYTKDKFIALCNNRRLPYTDEKGFEQYFRAFFLFDLEGKPAFVTHGTHAVFDAHPNLNLYCVLLSHLTDGKVDERADKLAWGTEWKNLPPGPITATGGPKPDWDTQGMQLFGIMQQKLNTPNPTLSMRPARDSPKNPGTNLRVIEVIDPETLSKLVKKSKAMGYSVSTLFEAAHSLAIFHSNKDVDPSQDIHVSMEGTYINLFKFMVPPYNVRSQIIGAMAMVPVLHPGSIVREHTETLDQLVAAMDNLKETYAAYVTNPHLSAITAVAGRMMPLKTVPVTRNANEAVVNNIGVVERAIPMRYPADAEAGAEGSPAFEITDVWFGHRLGVCPKLIVHFWTMGGKFHLMTQTNDSWDEEYLRDFLRRIVSIACTIL